MCFNNQGQIRISCFVISEAPVSFSKLRMAALISYTYLWQQIFLKLSVLPDFHISAYLPQILINVDLQSPGLR